MLTSISTIFTQGQIYLTIYAVLAATMLIEIFYESQVTSRWMARAGTLIIILFIGLRWETGTDWNSYLRIFYTNDSSSDYDSAVFGIDSGYILFNKVVYYFSTDYSIFLLLDAAIAVVAVYIFIEKSVRYPCMGVYLFYTSYTVTHFMGSNRRMLAIGFVCLGFLFLSRERRLLSGWPRWAVPFGIAAMVHRTSLAALPGLIVSRRAWSTGIVLSILIGCLLLGVAGLPFAGLEALGKVLSQYTGFSAIEKLVFYTSGEAQLDAEFNVVNQAILGVAKRSTVLLLFISYMQFAKPSEYAQRLYNIYIVGCAIYFAMLGTPIFQIISTFYSIVEIVLIPIILYDLKSYKIPYLLYLLIVPLLLLLSSLTPYLILYVPYRSLFNFY